MYLFNWSVSLMILTGVLCNACSPLKEFGRSTAYNGNTNLHYAAPPYSSSRKTVVIIANNDGTELFDMMAPFYLFNATGQANVYIIAKEQRPIVVKKGLFVLPQYTFAQVDSMGVKPDLIVIPFLAVADSLHQDPVIVGWIKKHYDGSNIIMSVCDGAATAAATGLFDGRPITAHAADYAGIKANFQMPGWVQHVAVAGGNHLYSTAGVSNAVEGSLVVIQQLFGDSSMQRVMAGIHYPSTSPLITHRSENFRLVDKFAVGRKLIFGSNKKLGVLLQPGVNEFDLAAVLDTYNRSFPKSIESFSANDAPVISKFGLTLLPTGRANDASLDELHVIGAFAAPEEGQSVLTTNTLIQYTGLGNTYIINTCLAQIREEYGARFGHVVKLMLDYN